MVPFALLIPAVLALCIIGIACGKRNHYTYFMGKKVVSIWTETTSAVPGMFQRLTHYGYYRDDDFNLVATFTKYRCRVVVGRAEFELTIPRALYKELENVPLPTKLSYRNSDPNPNNDPYSASHV